MCNGCSRSQTRSSRCLAVQVLERPEARQTLLVNVQVSNGEDGVEDVEGAEWNEDADFEDTGGSESEADSLDHFADEELGREGTDSDVEADVDPPNVQSDYSPWLGDPPIGKHLPPPSPPSSVLLSFCLPKGGRSAEQVR